MRLLLDTHALLSWLGEPALLSEPARSAIAEANDPIGTIHNVAVVTTKGCDIVVAGVGE